MEPKFNHFDSDGNAIMVDVSEKQPTLRTAVAEGTIRVSQEVLEAHREQLIRVAEYLLEYETMSAEDFTRVMGEPKAVLKQN